MNYIKFYELYEMKLKILQWCLARRIDKNYWEFEKMRFGKMRFRDTAI